MHATASLRRGCGYRLILCLILGVPGLRPAWSAPSVPPVVVTLDALQCPQRSPLAATPCLRTQAAREATRVQRQGAQCRFLDASGRALGARWFERCGESFVQEVALACMPGPGNPVGCGLISRTGEVVLPTIYQEIRVTGESPLASIRLGDKWGFFDIARRQIVLAPQFTHVNDFSEGLAYVEGPSGEPDQGGWLIAADGTRIAPLPPEVQTVGPFRDGLARAVAAGRWGYLGMMADWVIPAQFIEVTDFQSGRAMVKVSRAPEQWAMIDRTGRGVVFFEGASHQLEGWFGEAVLLEYGCDARDSSSVSLVCESLCFSLAGWPRQPLSCTRIDARR